MWTRGLKVSCRYSSVNTEDVIIRNIITQKTWTNKHSCQMRKKSLLSEADEVMFQNADVCISSFVSLAKHCIYGFINKKHFTEILVLLVNICLWRWFWCVQVGPGSKWHQQSIPISQMSLSSLRSTVMDQTFTLPTWSFCEVSATTEDATFQNKIPLQFNKPWSDDIDVTRILDLRFGFCSELSKNVFASTLFLENDGATSFITSPRRKRDWSTTAPPPGRQQLYASMLTGRLELIERACKPAVAI